MRILVGVSHPKHVYMFKNFIINMMKKGHEIKIVAVEREGITEYLLSQFNLPYELIGRTQPNIYKKMLYLPKWDYATLKIAKKFKPDIFIGQAHVNLAHISAFLNKPFILFEDTESATVLQKLCLPFTNAVATPSCYKGDFGKKHIRFNGYYELAYLHPNYFKPNSTILDDLNLSKDDKFVIVRFSSWNAIHDIRQHGFNFKDEQELSNFISELEDHGTVFINSEIKLHSKFHKYMLPDLSDIHSLIYYATLYIGEGHTMATEAAVLGTPSILVSSWGVSAGNFVEIEHRYNLVNSFTDAIQGLDKAVTLLETKASKIDWQKKRKKLLKDKIDVTAFMIWFVENYPESLQMMQANSKYQERFR